MSSAGTFFNEFADRFDTFYDGRRNRIMQHIDWQFRRDMFLRFARTFTLLGDLRGKHLLDIGCGSGPYIAEALQRGAALVTGIDPAPRMLELAQQRVPAQHRHQVRLITGCFPDVQPPPERIDAAIAIGVMDYVDDPVAFIESLTRVVADKVVLSFPSTHWFRTPLRRVRYRLRKCPVYFYTRERIRTIMQQAGVRQHTTESIPGAGMDYIVWLRI